MPTGYTAAIADGIDFETFVMRCSRAMGALIMMRDEPADAQIPARFEPSGYHTQKLAEANAELVKLRAMSDEETEVEARETFNSETKANSEAIARNRELRTKYEAMLSQVQAWEPPTPEHDGFKKFMVDQLAESISFDCSESCYEERKPKQQTGAEWRANQIARATRDVEYHMTEHAKEVERNEGRNAWLVALRNSLSTSNNN